MEAVLAGTVANAFVAVRPPGHHATAERGMGFCGYNNVAVAARHAQAVCGVERVLILDWDVHHGNGTQAIFWRDPSVLYCSLHQMPLYPGSGLPEERGEGPGAGATLNLPLPAGAAGQQMLQALRSQLDPLLEGFRPPPPWRTWGRCWRVRLRQVEGDGGASLRWGLSARSPLAAQDRERQDQGSAGANTGAARGESVPR